MNYFMTKKICTLVISFLGIIAIDLLFISSSFAINTCSTGYQIPASSTVNNIDCNGTCKNVTNSGSNAQFAATNTAAEWNSFISNHNGNITLAACGGGGTCGTICSPCVNCAIPITVGSLWHSNNYAGVSGECWYVVSVTGSNADASGNFVASTIRVGDSAKHCSQTFTVCTEGGYHDNSLGVGNLCTQPYCSGTPASPTCP